VSSCAFVRNGPASGVGRGEKKRVGGNFEVGRKGKGETSMRVGKVSEPRFRIKDFGKGKKEKKSRRERGGRGYFSNGFVDTHAMISKGRKKGSAGNEKRKGALARDDSPAVGHSAN